MEWADPKTPPNNNREVLIVRKSTWDKSKTCHDIGYFNHVQGYWRPRGSNGNFNDEVLLWMDLPEKP